MKYIRTKDKLLGEGIFVNDIPEPQNNNERELLEKMRENIGLTIIKEADTIEELCDEFVFIDDFFKIEHRIAFSLENALARCKYHNVDIKTLRGAIWTDKGLIYVAKMNDKGELKLL